MKNENAFRRLLTAKFQTEFVSGELRHRYQRLQKKKKKNSGFLASLVSGILKHNFKQSIIIS